MLSPLNLISKLFKSSNQKELDKLTKIVNQVNKLEENVSSLNIEEFPKKTPLRKIPNFLCLILISRV